MNQMSLIRILIILFFTNILESYISSILILFYINIPLTFLVFSYISNTSKTNPSPFFSFSMGLFVDLISGVFFGLNAILFCLMTYFINNYSNAFKLFSYFQIAIFFGVSSFFYIGFSNLFVNISNFSYQNLIFSFFVNTFLCYLVTLRRLLLPSLFKSNTL